MRNVSLDWKGVQGFFPSMYKKRETLSPFDSSRREVKLGKNKDLKHAVVGQLADYIAHIKANINEFADCYEENYSQKQYLGLIHPPLPSGLISIDRKEVEGMIVVGGYSKIAKSLMSTLVLPSNIHFKQYECILT
jgi:hypothetical protein